MTNRESADFGISHVPIIRAGTRHHPPSFQEVVTADAIDSHQYATESTGRGDTSLRKDNQHNCPNRDSGVALELFKLVIGRPDLIEGLVVYVLTRGEEKGESSQSGSSGKSADRSCGGCIFADWKL
jgi:hypothetical protein